MVIFQVLERINDNAYKLDLLGEYNVSATFNVTDLTPFDVGDELGSLSLLGLVILGGVHIIFFLSILFLSLF
jgi:hypothetical protein